MKKLPAKFFNFSNISVLSNGSSLKTHLTVQEFFIFHDADLVKYSNLWLESAFKKYSGRKIKKSL